MKRPRYEIIGAMVLWGLVLYLLWPTIAGVAQNYLSRQALAGQAEAFHFACLKGRDAAMSEKRRVSVRFGKNGWMVTIDKPKGSDREADRDDVIDSGRWSADVKLASSIPEKRFFFSEEGRCYIDAGTQCIVYEQENDGPAPHIIAITSEAPRIYTFFFNNYGEPLLEYDEY
jgi:hypothetical protein